MTDLLPTVTGTPVCGDSTVATDVSDKGDGEFHKYTTFSRVPLQLKMANICSQLHVQDVI